MYWNLLDYKFRSICLETEQQICFGADTIPVLNCLFSVREFIKASSSTVRWRDCLMWYSGINIHILTHHHQQRSSWYTLSPCHCNQPSDHHPLKPPLSTPTDDPAISNSAWAYPLIANRDTFTGGTGPKAIATHAKTHTAIYIVMISSLTLRGWLLSPSAAIPKPTICPEWDTSNHHFKWGKAIWNSN